MAIKIYDPKRGTYFEEAVSGEGFLKFLYGTPAGGLALEALVKRRLFQALAGAYCQSAFSRRAIAPFAGRYGIDLTEAIIPDGGFSSFNEFFARRLKDGARPYPNDPAVLVSPADGRVKVETNLDPERLLQIKGSSYSLGDLTGDKTDAKIYRGGTLYTIRLNPTDYHRFHYPSDGREISGRFFPGSYYSVNPLALKKIPQIYLRNKRHVSVLHTPVFGRLLFIAVGATSVGSIVLTHGEGDFLTGEEKGFFRFGGSTILLVLPPFKGRFSPRPDVIKQSALGFETLLPMGEELGRLKI